VRGYSQRSLERAGPVDAYEARVMAEKSALEAGLPRLALKGAVGQEKPIAAHRLMSAKVVPSEGQPSQSAVPVAVVALEKPAWDVYGGVSSSSLVAFSK
jgi:hypothetical protein